MFEMVIDHPSMDLKKVLIDFHLENEKIAAYLQAMPADIRPELLDEREVTVNDNIYERIFMKHKALHDNGLIDWSFTRFANLAARFDQEGYPYVYFDIARERVHEALIDLTTEIRLMKMKENRIVLGCLKLGLQDEEKLEMRALHVQSLLLEYAMTMQNRLVIRKNGKVFEITTDYKTLLDVTDHFKGCALIRHLSGYIDEQVSLGWGIGSSIIQARANSSEACAFAGNHPASATYIKEHEGQIIGPLLPGSHGMDVNQPAYYHPEKVNELQERFEMTRDKVNKVIVAFERIGERQVSSEAFAEALNLTVRSANRILKEAAEKGFVSVVVDTDSGLQGRPKKRYELNREFFKNKGK